MKLKNAYAFEVSEGKIQPEKKDSLWEALRLPLVEPMIVAFTGGGGKTTAMFCLADELAGQGKRVIVTTSTHIFYPVDRIVAEAADWKTVSDFISGHKEYSSLAGWVLVTGLPAGEEKLKGMELSELEKLLSLCDVLLVEADGAKRLPIKIPAMREPVIPKGTYAVIGCMGLDCIGEPWEKKCFRHELAPQIFGSQTMKDRITPGDAVRILTSTNGTRKGAESMEYRILMNKADDELQLSSAREVAEDMGEQWAEYCAAACFKESGQDTKF
ncbi:selenium cofactor biosynthesis protein YqeC [Lacrimispora sp. 38-1]|uniref:selenium cofactor biosynthesis protein YqeC n=1 Tax=Lacrimispora sp. 38-1 TaxID=3125778 RepID=UPI003CF19A7B